MQARQFISGARCPREKLGVRGRESDPPRSTAEAEWLDAVTASRDIAWPAMPDIVAVNEFRDVYGTALANMLGGADPQAELRKATAIFKGVLRTDRKILTPSAMSQHVAADLLRVGARRRRFVRDLAAMHHHDPVGEFQDLVQVFRNQQHGGACVARGHDPGARFRHRFDVQPEARIGDDQQPDNAVQFARQHAALHITAGSTPIGTSGDGARMP